MKAAAALFFYVLFARVLTLVLWPLGLGYRIGLGVALLIGAGLVYRMLTKPTS